MEGPEIHTSEAVIDNGSFGTRTIRFETGRLAQQAAGSAVAYLDDDTMLLSATTAGKHPKDQFDFFPLTIDVEERMYAAGRIPGSFFRREGRPSEDAILTCRLIDRPLRPSFVKGLRNEIQVVITVMSLNPDHLYDVVAINAASMSTQIAGLPFSGPIGATRVALIEGQWVAFPTHSQLEEAVFDMVVAGRVVGDDVAIMMVEAEATDQHDRARQGRRHRADRGGRGPGPRGLQAVHQDPVRGAEPSSRRSPPRRPASSRSSRTTRPTPSTPSRALSPTELAAALTIAGKQEREEELDRVKGLASERLAGQFEGREKEIGAALRSLTKKLVRQRVLTDKVRIDGRGLTDIRTLSAEVDVVPRVHGSALFERGETQILGVTTLNMLRMEQQLDTLSPETRKRYMHNYNFPPYSTGETGRVGSPKRREIGHGALAERALVPVLPTRDEFPYAIRQVSEALGSNGSTSMGSVCASTLSLLNAGVPLKAPVAGIAMGLISDEVDGKTEYVALTDILGAEDAFGDMDFKVAGTKEFVTALQLDTKLDGIPASVLGGALTQARDARLAILDVMIEAIDRPGRDVAVRAAHHHDPDPGRQDRRGHRPEGQDDQPDPGRDRRRDHDRGRRHDLHRCDRRPQGRGRAGADQRHRQPAHAGDRRALPGHRRQDHDVRRVHLAHAGQGRPAAHLQAAQARRRQARRERRGRRVHRPEGPGRDLRDRRRAASCRSSPVEERRRRPLRPRPPRATRPDRLDDELTHHRTGRTAQPCARCA